jgi:hypothetical protein
MTFSINGLYVTFSIKDTKLALITPSITGLYYYPECHYADSHYAECHYAECHYAECHYAKCHYAEWHYAESGILLIVVRNVVQMIVVMLSVMAP